MYNPDYSIKPKVKLFFDIETIPADEKLKDVAVELASQKELARTGSTRKSKRKLDYFYRQTAISGDFGRIFCIGYALNEGEVKVINGSEEEILNQWWNIADEADLFIGHNIMEFDLRFIFKRSIVHKIKPCAKHLNLSFARYKNFPIFDTMREWEKWSNSFIKLDTLAKVLGLKSSKDGGIDGSQVYEFFRKGRHEEIYEYCKRDVELTRNIYNRMIFYEYK
jgi:hypothetical protein